MKTSALFYTLLVAVRSNLICNGDFEGYNLTYDFFGDQYYEFLSNTSCWYNKNLGNFQVKQKLSPYTTKASQLTEKVPYSLCQNVFLKANTSYILSYSLFCPAYLSKMTLTVKLSDVVISTLYIATQNKFAANTYQFNITNTSYRQLCFSEQHEVVWSYLLKNRVGGLVDNITLQQIQPTVDNFQTATKFPYGQNENQAHNNSTITGNITVNNSFIDNGTNGSSIDNSTTGDITVNSTIQNNSSFSENTTDNNFPGPDNEQTIDTIDTSLEFYQSAPSISYDYNQHQQKKKLQVYLTTITKQLSWQIQFVSDTLWEDWMDLAFNNRVNIYIQGQIQKDFTVLANDQGLLMIVVKIYRSYDINKVQIAVQDVQLYSGVLQVQFYLDNRTINFNLLDKNQVEAIQKVQLVAEKIAEVVYEVYIVFSSSLSSYFVLNLFNFWNLSLMYSFMLLESVPNFSRNIYEVMMNLIYQKGGILVFLKQTIGIPESYFNIQFQERLPQYMTKFNQGLSWFGNFGFSSKVLSNNLEAFLILAFLLIKILIAKAILKCIPQNIKNTMQMQCNFKIIVLCEIIAICPFIMISAGTMILNSAYMYNEKLEKLFQISLFFVCLILLPLWIIERYKQISNLKKKIKALTAQLKSPKFYGHQTNPNKTNTDKLQRFIGLQNIKEMRNELKSEMTETIYTLTEFYFNITIPILVLTGNTLGFLIINFGILIGRSIYLIKNASKMRIIHRIFAFIMTFIWIVHHISFCIFYAADLVKTNLGYSMPNLEIYLGIIIVVTVFSGGALQLLQFACSIVYLSIILIRRIIKFCKCCNKNQIAQQDNLDNLVQNNNEFLGQKQNHDDKFSQLGQVVPVKFSGQIKQSPKTKIKIKFQKILKKQKKPVLDKQNTKNLVSKPLQYKESRSMKK